MLCGGINPSIEISEFAAAFVANNAAAINTALSVTNASYAVVHEAVQVAGGVNHFLHINGSDGNPYTITLNERSHPNHSGVIIEAAAGHPNLVHGYGNIVHPEHPHSQQH
jgi:hypothetical protein